MPFGEYEDFDACVADNSDKEDPEAYCAEIKRQVEGEDALTESQLEAAKRFDGEVDIEHSLSAVFQLGGIPDGPIERVEEGDNTIRYKSIRLISPGVWTDSASRETVWYSPTGMKNLEVRQDNTVNLMHDDNEVSEVGSIDPESLTQSEEGVFGDLVIDTSSAAGEYADENLQTTLESGGATGFGGPSVEIDAEGQKVEYNDEKGMRELIGGIISGLGLVKNPAAKSVSFARQVADRGVALSDSEQTHKVFHRSNDNMVDAETKQKVLANVDEEFTLQGAMDQIQDDAQAIADELDVGIDEVLEVLDPLLDVEDEEEEEVENEDDEENENEGEEEEEEEEDDMDMEDRVDALEERLTNMEDMMESAMQAEDFEEELSEELEEVQSDLADAETVEELEAELEEAEKRLSELEEEPQKPKALADRENGDEPVEGVSRPVARKARDGAIRK